MNLVPMMLLWLVISVIGWGFVFTRITTFSPEEKIALYVDGEVPGSEKIAALLMEEAHPAIRTVEVRPFTYAMFGGDELRQADLFIVPESNLETYREFFAPWPEEMGTEGDFHTWDGVPWGLKVYDKETGMGFGLAHVAYEVPYQEKQDYYLFFGNQSCHLEGNEGAVDNLAVEYAKKFMLRK